MIKSPEIIVMGDPRLKTRAGEVEKISDCLPLVKKMKNILKDHKGVGLAANQVGALQRVIIWSVLNNSGVLINPRITFGDEKVVAEEGCLSIPGMAGNVERSLDIVAEGLDEDGNVVSVSASGLLARVIQHEVDHLDGILFIEKVVPGTLHPVPLSQVAGI